MMQLKSDFHPWHEKRLAIVPCDMNQADCTKTLTASASCDSVRFAQFCLLSHSSRAMCPTLLSLLSLGEFGKTESERLMVEIGGSSHHRPDSWCGCKECGVHQNKPSLTEFSS